MPARECLQAPTDNSVRHTALATNSRASSPPRMHAAHLDLYFPAQRAGGPPGLDLGVLVPACVARVGHDDDFLEEGDLRLEHARCRLSAAGKAPPGEHDDLLRG